MANMANNANITLGHLFPELHSCTWDEIHNAIIDTLQLHLLTAEIDKAFQAPGR